MRSRLFVVKICQSFDVCAGAIIIIEYFKIFKPVKVRVESVGYQEMLREYLKQRCSEEGIFISGLEIKENPRTRKSYRLESLQPIFANNKVFIQKNMQALVDELTLYTRGKHDDLLDGFFYANKNCYKPVHEAELVYEEDDYLFPQRKNWKLKFYGIN